MANSNLTKAKKGKNDEFYTQFQDIQKEINAYLEYDPNVFKGKTILLPCDDPEWSNFTKFFAQNFTRFGLKKLISTSFAPESKNIKAIYAPTLFEQNDPKFDKKKTITNGKIFTLTKDKTGDGKIDVNDLEWAYLKGDGDFRSAEIKKLRDEADIIITNPPFSLFREFLTWIMEGNKKFLILGNMNAITYKEVFPLIKDDKIWAGSGFNMSMVYRSPNKNILEANRKFVQQKGYDPEFHIKVPAVNWYTNLPHHKRFKEMEFMTMKKIEKHGKGLKFIKYENYNAIEIPLVKCIPIDYKGIMGVPITFLQNYNPEQFEILGNGQTMANELGIKPIGQKFVDDYYAQGNKGQINAKWNNLVYRDEGKTIVPFQRILIKHKK